MREIKFRIWDKILNKFNYFDIYSSYGQIPDDSRENIQQFTGIKDKEGGEIYEGDILEIYFPYMQDKLVYLPRNVIVEYSEYGFEPWALEHEDINWDKVKIVGNIFQLITKFDEK